MVEKVSHLISNGRKTLSIFNVSYLLNNDLNVQVQFVAIFTHQFQLLVTECDYPKGFMVWIALHGIMFLFLFSDFYKVKYTKGHKKVRSNPGICMVSSKTRLCERLIVIWKILQPVLEEEHNNANGALKKANENATLNNSYIKSEFSDSYKACYSNGSTKGFVSQSIIKLESKKIEQ